MAGAPPDVVLALCPDLAARPHEYRLTTGASAGVGVHVAAGDVAGLRAGLLTATQLLALYAGELARMNGF